MDILTFVKDHFAHAAPVLFLAALAAAICLERFYALMYRYPILQNERFFEKLSELVLKAQLPEAVRHCDSYKGKPVAALAKAALVRAHLPERIIYDGVQLSYQKCARAVQKRTAFLATIANVATLLGLFGTVAGLIQSFQAVAHADPQQKSALLSAGIATAMNATMLGLAVAIPCMLAYSFLMSRTNALLSDLEQAVTRTMDVLKQRFYSSELVKPETMTAQEDETPRAA